jgi:hypothetical protein
MLKAGKLTPTSNHTSEFEAVEAAKFRSNNLQNEEIIGETLDRGLKRDPIGRIIEYQPSGPHVDEPTPVIVNNTNEAMLEKIKNEKASNQDQRSFGQTFKDAMSKVAGVAEMGYTGDKARDDKAVNDAENAFQGMNNNRTFGQKFLDAFGNPAIANVAGMSYTGDQARADKLINDAENAFQNQDTIDPIVEYNQGQAELLAQSKALSEKNRKSFAPLYQIPDHPYGVGSSVASNYADFKGTGTQTDGRGIQQSPGGDDHFGDAQFDASLGIQGSPGGDAHFEGASDGIEAEMSRNWNKIYKDGKANKTISIPKGKPDYGEMPGFKLPPKDDKGKSTGNYWSVDEKSPFWQTDAGYEKAMQTWGEKPGWVKPGYRPKKKELDINAIKKWFTPSK